MAYTPNTWKDGDVITAEKLNAIEQGISNEQVGPEGPKGDPGADGKGVKSLSLTKDTSGAITGGTLTLSDNSTVPVTVTTAGG